MAIFIPNHDPISIYPYLNKPPKWGLSAMIEYGWAYPALRADAEADLIPAKTPQGQPIQDGRDPVYTKDGTVLKAGKEWWDSRSEWFKELCQPFLAHLQGLMRNDPRDVDIFLDYMAFKQQNPGSKIRWAIVMAGEQGVGKDVSLDACWEHFGIGFVKNVSPDNVMGSFNDFLRNCYLLRISEVADLNEANKWKFNERLKVLISGHPDLMLINQKYGFMYWAKVVCGVVLTTNHLESGIYMPQGDRRYYVIKCSTPEDMGLFSFDEKKVYFNRLFHWFTTPAEYEIPVQLRTGGADKIVMTGYEIVGNYLFWFRNVSSFEPNICPAPTAAKIEVVDFGNAIPDWMDELMNKYALELEAKRDKAPAGLLGLMGVTKERHWPELIVVPKLRELALKGADGAVDEDSKRILSAIHSPARVANTLKKAGYLRVPNPNRKDTQWVFTDPQGARRQFRVYYNSKIANKLQDTGAKLWANLAEYCDFIGVFPSNEYF